MSVLLIDFNSSRFYLRFRESVAAVSPGTIWLDPVFGIQPREVPNFLISSMTDPPNLVSPFGQNRPLDRTNELPSLSLESRDLRAAWTSMDRVFLEPLSMLEREQIWDGWCRGWDATIEHFDHLPATAIFISTPHFHWDIALSTVLQGKNVKVLSLSPSAIDGLILLNEIERSQARAFVEFENPASLGAEGRKRGMPSKIYRSGIANNHYRHYHSTHTSRRNPLKTAYRTLRTFARLSRYALSEPDYWPYGKIKRFSLVSKWHRKKAELLKVLDQIGITKMPEKDFVYFALHFQPERSTTPEAGDFWFQLNAIRKLRDALPGSIEVVVGEHPRQVLLPGPDLRQTLFRSSSYYRQIDAIPGVKLAHWSLEGACLLESAKLVATCTGSSAWEAMQLGIPSLVFGLTYYSMSDSCVRADNFENLQEHIRNLLQKEPGEVLSDNEAVYAFTEKNGVPGFTGPSLPIELSDTELTSLSLTAAERVVSAMSPFVESRAKRTEPEA